MELNFQRNLGALDRGIRVVISLVLFGLAAMGFITGWIATITNILGLFNLLEAAIGY
ncbi:Protein of unknown function (DUF2892) [Desulfosporosinus orientis DSM 765]|uniref:Inner membrane protein YgaP-like transmembrane domain-containing protein n=1 Tax=Desulfosporosinus orientis (strain ATCC 19365 / DSM 765 / NCIMB 8382 / VKM B-1628 / Singapore I) TaxID=768706 RepID=G7WF98_DESOD|nr:YgaP-like transmembrane domain [Desulfosporosinus orientis]AET67984.1 Protein of unknown function (DUF2892) [Desulfosporosinus orientis DSM 765]